MSISLVIGTMIGAGIFFLPSSLAPLGWNAVIGWLISGAGAICLAMTFRFLMDGTGEGIQHNIERVLGEVPGFLGIWAYWAAGFTSIAALSLAGGSIIASLAFDDPDQRVSIFVALGLLWAMVGVNLLGTRSAGRVQVVSVVIKVIPLVLVIGIFVWGLAGSAELQPMAPMPVDLDNISAAVALTLFALLGFEAATVPVNKISNPSQNIPLALIGGTLLVVLLYLLASTGIVRIIPWEAIATSSSPFSDVLTNEFGALAGTAVALCILVSVTGCTNGLILVGAECSYSMALRGEMPRAFSWTNSTGVAYHGVLLTGVIATALILANMSRGLTGMFTFMVLLTSGGVLVFYLMAALAAVKENRSHARWPVLALGVLFIGLATYGSGLETSLWVGVLLGFGAIVRWFCRRNFDVGELTGQEHLAESATVGDI
ncbi:MAG: amino acid permease [Erythrobacter sp.]|nr:MAG: amino acid permease [Erythrobacter sp.]